MLKSEMQHQFWVTKKAVQRKLGTKEDECIVSSDAELDAKIELFRSITESSGQLYRIIDHYQERLCILAQEENSLGKFLKEMGKSSNTTGKVMLTAGKSISYCGQQRMTIRPSLLRLFHEVEVFRGRAIADTQTTILAMEKERTEYRAALSWMKSASNQLDPDTGKGLEKFRKSQTHVRLSKAKFDRLALDCLQKIDLLAAARCNMFSHVLVAYMSAFLQFTTKSSETFKATAEALATNPQYNFCVLKDLSEMKALEVDENTKTEAELKPIDSDQMLFFMDDYHDEINEEKSKQSQSNIEKAKESVPSALESVTSSRQGAASETVEKLIDIDVHQMHSGDAAANDTDNNFSDAFGDFISSELDTSHFMPSQLLLGDLMPHSIPLSDNEPNSSAEETQKDTAKTKNSIMDFLSLTQTNKGLEKNSSTINTPTGKLKDKSSRKDMSAWFHLFSELDPLANPDAIASKIDGGKANSQAA